MLVLHATHHNGSEIYYTRDVNSTMNFDNSCHVRIRVHTHMKNSLLDSIRYSET